MRIIAGTFKGRRLAGPSGPGLRPTSDSLRETLFNVLGPSVTGARVLDGFAGTGAVGLEALSRGAARVTLVERDSRAARAIETNVERWGVKDVSVVVQNDFASFASSHAADRLFDLIFLDPPYDLGDYDAVLASAALVAAPNARCVLEHSRRRQLPETVPGWQRTRLLTAGDSALSFYVSSGTSGR